MKITGTALSLNVADVAASAAFATTHFGFTEAMADDGFVSLAHPDAGVNIVFLRTGLGTFKPTSIAGPAGQGLLIAFVVDDLDAEFALYGIARRRLTGLRTAAGVIRVVEMRPLTPRATLALVAVRDREYLLAVGQSGATLIAQVRGEADPGPPDFQAVLAEQEP